MASPDDDRAVDRAEIERVLTEAIPRAGDWER